MAVGRLVTDVEMIRAFSSPAYRRGEVLDDYVKRGRDT